jgi:ubiquinone/menaquinone biosynthesis C-methylase UbiE
MNQAPYDAIATWYDAFVRERPLYSEIVLPGMLELAGDIEGQSVCDIACGQGLVSRELARRGARVTGVDISAKLLDLARRYEETEPLGIHYIQDDAETLQAVRDTRFDGATCGMALMNINDLASAFQALRLILKPDGWFLLAITHPCFQTPRAEWVTKEDGSVVRQVAAYFDERFWEAKGRDGVRSRVGEHHRMLSTYVNTLVDAGFELERMAEPRATGRRAEQTPGNREIPSVLLMRWRRSS